MRRENERRKLRGPFLVLVYLSKYGSIFIALKIFLYLREVQRQQVLT